ncbi:nuclease PIN [Sinomonas halotolerans]|uniref:Nuclease PIN n=1 Tax=Sinomonas halotolerans TaxID=1644133 RepID=A0ABU9WX95_9MICC
MKIRLFPQETAGLELLAAMSQQAVHAVQVLSEMFGARRSDYEELVESLSAIDSRTGELSRTLLTQLRTSFVNPLPREDLLVLSDHLLACVGHLLAVGELLHLHGIERLPREASDQLEIVNRQAELTTAAMRRLSDLDDLEDYWGDMLRLIRRSEHTHRVWSAGAMKDLSITNYARSVEAARELLAAARELTAVATYVGRIIVKES